MKTHKYTKSRRVLNSNIEPKYIITHQKAVKFIDSVDLKNTGKENRTKNLTKFDYLKSEHKDIVNLKYNEHLIAFKGINSPAIATLTKMLNQNISTKEIQKIIDQHTLECMEFLTKIEKDGITYAHTTIILLLIDELIKNLKIRRMIITQIIYKQAYILLPHSSNLRGELLNFAARDLEYIREKKLLPHLLHHLIRLTQDIMKLKI